MILLTKGSCELNCEMPVLRFEPELTRGNVSDSLDTQRIDQVAPLTFEPRTADWHNDGLTTIQATDYSRHQADTQHTTPQKRSNVKLRTLWMLSSFLNSNCVSSGKRLHDVIGNTYTVSGCLMISLTVIFKLTIATLCCSIFNSSSIPLFMMSFKHPNYVVLVLS